MRKDIQRLGRTSPRGPARGGLLLLIGIAVLAAGCQSVAKPQGWAPPRIEDGTLYASTQKGKLTALDANVIPEAAADCDDAEDNDADGGVNEGCPKVGQKSESGSECLNNTSDDLNGGVPDDSAVNDGCPATLMRWVFPPNTDEGKKLLLEGIYAAPVVDGDTVYFGAYDGNVYALNSEDGTPRWRFKTNDPVVGALTFNDRILYAGSTDGRLYAIDTSKCTNVCPVDAVRTFDTGSSIWASPLLVENVIYVAAMDGRLHALDAATLEPAGGFSFKTDAGLLMDPTLAGDDTLLVGGIDSKLYAVNPATGDETWSFEGANWFWGKPLIDGETAFIADLDGNVYAVGLADGTPQWPKPFKAGAAVRSAPLLAGNTLVVIDRDGNAYGLDPHDGTQQWGPTLLGKTVLSDPFLLESATTPSPTPGTETSEVLVVAQGGDLCRIDPVDGSPVTVPPCVKVPL